MRLYHWAAALFAAFHSLPASAADNPWVPAVTGWGGVTAGRADADVTSSPASRPDISGNQDLVYSSLALGVELMSPKLSLPGAPAMFVHGGAQFGFAPGWNIAKEGAAGPIEVPTTPLGGFPPPSGATGTGTTARSETQLVSYAAGIGLAFEIGLWERTLRLRPSFEYRRDEFDYRLRLSDAQDLGTPLCPCGLAQLNIQDQQSFHWIGPGVELELDVARSGPLMMGLFISGRAYHLLGDREERLRLTGVYTPSVPAQEPITAEAIFEREPWTFQVGVGLRLRWLPEL